MSRVDRRPSPVRSATARGRVPPLGLVGRRARSSAAASRSRSRTSSGTTSVSARDSSTSCAPKTSREPLRNTLVLATTVALAATALGTALAWLVTRTTCPVAACGGSSCRCRSSCRASSARSRSSPRSRPGGLVDDVFGFDSRAAHRRVLGRRARPHVAHLPIRVPAGRGAARLVTASLEESARALGTEPPAGVPHDRAAAVHRARCGRAACSCSCTR